MTSESECACAKEAPTWTRGQAVDAIACAVSGGLILGLALLPAWGYVENYTTYARRIKKLEENNTNLEEKTGTHENAIIVMLKALTKRGC